MTARPLESTDAVAAPVFIGGLFKSGTTLLRAMLGQHRAIHSGLETHWFDLKWPPRDAPPKQAQHLDRLRQFFGLDADEMERLVRTHRSGDEFIAAFMARAAEKTGKTRWCEKTPQNILHADRILSAFPGSVLIHMVRDPRDVLASIHEAGRQDWVAAFPEMWCASVGLPERRWRDGEFDPARFLRVRYEDLVLKPEATMRAVLAGIGADWDGRAAVFEGRGDDFDLVKSVVGKESSTLRRLKNPMERGRIGLAARVLPAGLIADVARSIEQKGFAAEFERVIREREQVTGVWSGFADA